MSGSLHRWATTFQAAYSMSADGYLGGATKVYEMPEDIVGGTFFIQATKVSGTTTTVDINYRITPDDGTTYFPVANHTQIADASTDLYLNINMCPLFQAGTEDASRSTTGTLSDNVTFSRKFKVYVDVGGTNPVYTIALFFIGWRQLGVAV
jgi:hypothetical protein